MAGNAVDDVLSICDDDCRGVIVCDVLEIEPAFRLGECMECDDKRVLSRWYIEGEIKLGEIDSDFRAGGPSSDVSILHKKANSLLKKLKDFSSIRTYHGLSLERLCSFS